MKNITMSLFLGITLTVSSVRANSKRDTFFKNNTTQFIKTDLVSGNVKFSACELIDAFKSLATCTAIAQIKSDEFSDMRKCMGGQTIAAATAVGVGVGIAFAGLGIGSFAILSVGDIAGVSAVGGGGFWVVSTRAVAHGNTLYGDKYQVFAEDVENDVDHFAKTSYDSFVEKLKDSLEYSFWACDVEGESEILNEAAQNVTLTKQQKFNLTGKIANSINSYWPRTKNE